MPEPRARSSSPRDATQLVLPASITSGSLIAQHVAGKATRDSLFLTHFGVELLPAAMIGAAVLSSLAMFGASRVLATRGPARVVPAALATSAVLHALEALLASRWESLVAVTIYLHSAVFGAALGSAFWSLVNERFDPREAKRAVGRIAAGGTVGGILGGILAWRAASFVPAAGMLGLLACTNLVGLAATRPLASAERRGRVSPDAEGPPTESPWKALSETPYLRDLALLVLAGAVLQALLDWLLGARAAEIYTDKSDLLAFFALFNMVVGVASFVAQTGLSRVLLERLGLGGTVRLQPIVTSLFGAVALLGLGTPSIVALRGAEAVSRNSFFRSAYELFYTPLPPARKRPTKALVDVGFDRLGTFLGSGALLLVAFLPDVETRMRVVLVGALLASGAAVVIGSRLQDGYVRALAESLKSGAVALGDDDLMDLTTRRTLAETTALLDREKLLARIEAFHRSHPPPSSGTPEPPEQAEPASADAAPRSRPGAATLPPLEPDVVLRDATVLRVAALRSGDPVRIRAELATPLAPELAPFVIPLLGVDPIARDALRALRRLGPSIAGLLVDQLLDPSVEPRVRRRIPRALRAADSELAARGLFMALRDPVFDVRVQAGLALAGRKKSRGEGPHAPKLDPEAVFDVVVHEIEHGRRGWGGEPTRGLTHVFTVLGLAMDPEPLAIALRALRSDDAALRGTAHEYLDVVLPPRVLALLSPILGLVERRGRPRPHAEIEDELRAHLPRLRDT